MIWSCINIKGGVAKTTTALLLASAAMQDGKAVKVSDFIIIPSSPRSADLSKTYETVSTFEEAGKPYAVLLTSARKGTLALKGALTELEDEGVSYCSSVIYQREELASYFGNSLPLDGDLYGYTAVYDELKEATGYGD